MTKTLNPSEEVYLSVFEHSLEILEKSESESSDDIAALLMNLADDVEAPSVLHNLFIEMSLAAESGKEVGLTCYNLKHMEEALKEYKEKGTTDMMEAPRK